MVEDPECQEFIFWSPSGTSVIISDVDAFCAGVLGKHFKHNNFSSFIRQLNMYGFYKVNKSHRAARASGQPQTWEFSHAQFRRGRTDLLETIRRRTLDTESVRYEATRDLQNDMSVSYGRLQTQLSNMSDSLAMSQAENATLWSFVSQLRATLAQVIERSNLEGVVPVPNVPSHRLSPSMEMPVAPRSGEPVFAYGVPQGTMPGAPPPRQSPGSQHAPAMMGLPRPVTAPSISQSMASSMLLHRSSQGSVPIASGATGPVGNVPGATDLAANQPFFPRTARMMPMQPPPPPPQGHYASIQLPGAPPQPTNQQDQPPMKRRALGSDVVSDFNFLQ